MVDKLMADGEVGGLPDQEMPSQIAAVVCDVDKKRTFDIQREMGSLTFRERGLLTKDIKIMTLNIGGLRTPYKVESLKSMAAHLKISIGVITETHLLNKEVGKLVIPGYKVVDKAGSSRHKGGVMILVDGHTSVRKPKGLPKPEDAVDACTVLVYPASAEEFALRLTGLYLPPSAEVTQSMLEKVVGPAYQTFNRQGVPASHLIMGDLNPNCSRGGGKQLYLEWVLSNELWELSDPSQATFKTGSSLDKILLRPGADIPEEWLPPEGVAEQADEKGASVMKRPYYPATVFPRPWIDDHHPVLISLGGIRPETQAKPHRALKIGQLSREDWQNRDEELSLYLGDEYEKIQNAIHQKNPSRVWELIQKGITKVLSRYYRKKGGSSSKPSITPFQLYCKRHVGHPEYQALIGAALRQDTKLTTEIMNRVSRDGWREFLSKVSPMDTRAIFRYLAKEDGRVPRARVYSCDAPLINEDGEM